MEQRPSAATADGFELLLPPGGFWAKLHPRESPTEWHPLLAHSADVAAVLRRLLQPSSILSTRLAHLLGEARLSKDVAACLVYLAALHDLGKTNHGFQEQWKRTTNRSPGHVRVVLDSLGFKPLQDVWLELLAPVRLPRMVAHDLLQTTVCHHGRPWDASGTPNIPIWQTDHPSGRNPLAEIRRLASFARTWAGIDEIADIGPARLPTRFVHLYAGILTLADWIASTRAAFAFAPWANDTPERYWEEALRRADQACSTIGLTPATIVTSLAGLPLLERLFPKVFGESRTTGRALAEPTPLQRHIAQMKPPAAGSRVLMESETGSGKTEAALALYARLRAAGRVGGLVFALPTRATASAMHERVSAALEAMYEPGERPTLVLAMGGVQVEAEATHGTATSRELLTGRPITYPDPASSGRAGDSDLVRWSSSATKKFFAGEIVISTLDQLLLGGLAVKHAHLRMAAFSRHLLIVDELHSYDRYMAEVLERVLEMHSTAGGVSLLMSATLSDRERLRFGGLLASEDEQTPYDAAVARAYPVISVSAETGAPWRDIDLQSAAGAAKPTLGWRLCGADAALAAAVEAARAGARVCILRNTVKGARATIEELHLIGAEGFLWRPPGSPHTPAYHSRYIRPDRLRLDRCVLAAYARGCGNGTGRILVATQVVEQSLDVDFDLLITDLCPIDVLLQRIGRVWRHRERDESRPAICQELQVWVIEPENGFQALLPLKYGGPNGWGTVYDHLGYLELTRRLLADRCAVSVPRDNRILVESVYHVEPQQCLRKESEAWDEHFLNQEGRTISHELTAKGASIEFAETYIANAQRFNGDAEASIRTRLGDDRVLVELPGPLFGHYDDSNSVDTVDLPFERLRRADIDFSDLKAVTSVPKDGMTGYRLQGFNFAYGPQGWEWDV